MNNRNEPAYPTITEIGSIGGLTKREYFAGLVLQGLSSISFNAETVDRVCKARGIKNLQDVVAIQSVEYADALLAELEKRK